MNFEPILLVIGGHLFLVIDGVGNIWTKFLPVLESIDGFKFFAHIYEVP